MNKNRVGLFDFNKYESIVSSINRVLDRSRKKVRSTLFWEAVETGTTVRAAAEDFGLTPHVHDEKMQRFYEETDAFVFELVVGHMHDACKQIDARVIESVDQFAKGDRVLCLGDGIGTDTLRFAEDGFDVTYFEFEGPSSQFAHHRFTRAGVESDVEQIHELAEIPYGKYDVVINREVLEHVPNPPKVIKDIRNYLDEDGLAIITESFSRIEDRFPTHLASNRKYAGKTKQLFVKEGFTLIDSYPEGRPIVFRKTERSDASRFDSLPPYYPVRNLVRRVAKKVLSFIPA